MSVAHDAVFSFVDLDMPDFSRLVARMTVDRHNCGSAAECDKLAGDFIRTMDDWNTILNGGIVEGPSCAPSFPQDLILLSDLPYTKSVTTLLGDGVFEQKDTPDPATKLFTQKSTVANTSLINTRLDWAAYAADNFQRRSAQLSGCLTAERNCARAYIEKTARRAFKRPLVNGEVDDLMQVFDTGSSVSFTYGLRLAAQAILMSPSFNHRTEYGRLNGDGVYELTPHEFASTLSYMLTDSLPDEELSAAADAGRLNDPDERERQAARMLAQDATRASMEFTLLSAWNFGNLFGKAKDPAMFPQYSANLAAQMYEETRLFLRKYLWSGGVSQVLTGRTTFVNGALADLYGIPFSGTDRNQFVETQLTDDYRAGLLTQASFLTAYSRTDETSVVARGLFVNGPLLCLPKVPPPPLDVISEVEEQLSSGASELNWLITVRAPCHAKTATASSMPTALCLNSTMPSANTGFTTITGRPSIPPRISATWHLSTASSAARLNLRRCWRRGRNLSIA
ncbi:MAG: DUF1592 domain-containing protein [Cellvibrionaceae bacterium]|nr:DUF1592 domain-containing protein [Cellvibrionaceae bacterium]